MLTSKQRAFLRSQATSFDTVLQIGKGGVTENMLVTIEAALTAHEMVKIKCLENCEYTPKEAGEGIAEAIGADVVQVIGNKFILFKISPENRRYDLEKLSVIEKKAEKKPLSKRKVQESRSRCAGKNADKNGSYSKKSTPNFQSSRPATTKGGYKKNGTGQKNMTESSASGRYTVTKKNV